MTFHLTHFRDLRRPAAIGLLAASLLVSLAACGADTSGASAPPPAAATAAPADTGATGAAATPAMDMTAEAPAAGAADAAPTAAAAGATNAVEIKATLREWALDLSQTEVPAGPVHFVIANAGQMPHNFTIKGDWGCWARRLTSQPRRATRAWT